MGRIIRWVDTLAISTEQLIRVGIMCAKPVFGEPDWAEWVDGWLTNRDRSSGSAEKADKATRLVKRATDRDISAVNAAANAVWAASVAWAPTITRGAAVAWAVGVARAVSALPTMGVTQPLNILAIIQQAIEEEQYDDHEGVYYREEPVDAPVYYPVYGMSEFLCSSGVYVADAEIRG